MCERESGERESGAKEGKWEEVKYKRHQKGGFHQRGSIPISKFYVANIPDGCRPWDLADAIRDIGEIGGVYIARKKNKEGVRFGFISIKGVKDVKATERALNKVKMGDCRLQVNLARFAVENGQGEHRKEAGRTQGFNSKSGGFHKSATGLAREGVSFKDAVTRVKSSSGAEKVIALEHETSAMAGFHQRALVGKCNDLKILARLGPIFVEEGVTIEKLVYLGGMSVLIAFPNKEAASGFVYKIDIWRMWFSKLETWNGQPLPFERLAWLKIMGVPLHLACSNVSDMIGSRFGKVVQPSIMDDSDSDKAIDRVGILVGEGRMIEDEATLKWKDKSFKVWLSEDRGDWFPDLSLSAVEKPERHTPEMSGGEHGNSFRYPHLAQEFGVHGNSKNSTVHGEIEVGHSESTNEAFNFVAHGRANKKRFKSRKEKVDPSFKYNAFWYNVNCSWVNKSGGFSPRPNKRPRKEEDNIGLNPVLGLRSPSVIYEPPKVPGEPTDCDKQGQAHTQDSSDSSLDLNNCPGPDEKDKNEDSSGDGLEVVAESLDHQAQVAIQEEIEKEASETIGVGKLVGTDLSGFVAVVKSAIVKEGTNVFHQ